LETGLLISPEDDESPVVDQYQIGNVNLIWRKLENIDNLPNVQTRTTNHTSAAINQLPKFKPGVIHYSAGSRVKKERPDLRKVPEYFFLMIRILSIPGSIKLMYMPENRMSEVGGS
jgi:hypothetical protein